jgi:hypothetical protein
MPDVSGPPGVAPPPPARICPPPPGWTDGSTEPQPRLGRSVSRSRHNGSDGGSSPCTRLAFISTSLVFLAPLLVPLALRVNSLVGIQQAPNSLAVVTGIGALLAMVANPFFGKLSDRTSSRLGMRRPWMVTVCPSRR